jgi:hypothetical protein
VKGEENILTGEVYNGFIRHALQRKVMRCRYLFDLRGHRHQVGWALLSDVCVVPCNDVPSFSDLRRSLFTSTLLSLLRKTISALLTSNHQSP